MKSRKIIILIILLSLTGCNKLERKINISVILKSTTSQFFKSVSDGANSAAKEYNLTISCVGPNNEEDYESQNRMIENAINQNVDVIVLSAIDYSKTVEPVERAIDKGIKVVIIDSDVNSDKVTTRISTNNYEAGSMAGKEVLKMSNQTINVGIVNFNANTANGQERQAGFEDTILNDARVTGVNVINVSSNITETIAATKKLILEHPEINAIATFNEWTSLGVGNAIRELGYHEKIKVIAFDNNPVSVQMLETGEVDALIVQTPFAIGYLGVEQAYFIASGKNKIEKNIYTQTVAIDKDNLFDKENQKIVFPFD